MSPARSTSSCAILHKTGLWLGLLLALPSLPLPFVVVPGGLIEKSPRNTFLVDYAEARVNRPKPPPGNPRTERRTTIPRANGGHSQPEVRRHAEVRRHHTPQRHIHRNFRRDSRRTAVVTFSPSDCEEVSGEEATFYCDGVYYRAYYQGNNLVFVPEAEME